MKVRMSAEILRHFHAFQKISAILIANEALPSPLG